MNLDHDDLTDIADALAVFLMELDAGRALAAPGGTVAAHFAVRIVKARKLADRVKLERQHPAVNVPIVYAPSDPNRGSMTVASTGPASVSLKDFKP